MREKKNQEVILGAGVSELGDHGPLFLGSFSELSWTSPASILDSMQ